MIQANEAKRLPLALRLAWGCSVVERAVQSYSPHAKRKYFLEETLDSLWRLAQGEAAVEQQCQELLNRLNYLYFHFPAGLNESEEDEEGYTFGFATLGVCLLNEVRDDSGSPVVTAVCQAATSYADHVFYCHGVGSACFWLGYEWYDRLSEPVMHLSEACYRAATGSVGQPVRRGMFDWLELGAPAQPPVAEVLARVTSKPPPAEAAWIQQSGRGVGPR